MRFSKLCSCFLLLLPAIFIFSSLTVAQEQASTTPAIPPLPAPDDPEMPLLISQKNVSMFHELLLAPIASWLKEGDFVIRAASKQTSSLKSPESWKKASEASFGLYGLDENGNLEIAGAEPSNGGLPFGGPRDLASESDPERKARKVLWTSSYIQRITQDMLYGFELVWSGSRSVLRSSNGVLYSERFWGPQKLQNEAGEVPAETEGESEEPVLPQFSGPDDIFWKETLRLLSPPVVFGFSQVTWRYRGSNEDRVWVYSPVIERSRKVFGANRSDALIGSTLTADDIFVWSGKNQLFDAQVVEEKELLVPVPSLEQYYLKSERIDRDETTKGEVLTVAGPLGRPNGGGTMVLWNFDIGRFPSHSPWTPASVYFVPRPVWVIELKPRDPFYQSGRQILVVDRDTFLPIYKVVYHSDGSYKKTVIGAWGVAGNESGKSVFPFCAFVLSVEPKSRFVTSLTTLYVQTSSNGVLGTVSRMRDFFDIENHSPTIDDEEGEEEEEGSEA